MMTSKKLIKTIIDLEGYPAFEGLLTYTCVTILDNAGTLRPLVGTACAASDLEDIRNIKLFEIDYNSMGAECWCIRPKEIVDNIRKIESIGSPLADYVARFTTGIATLRNDLYILNSPVRDGRILVEIDGKHFSIEEQATVSIIKPNKVKS